MGISNLTGKRVNPIQNGHFWGCSRMEGAKRSPLLKFCHTFPAMMNHGTIIPYLKKIKKNESRDTPPESS